MHTFETPFRTYYAVSIKKAEYSNGRIAMRIMDNYGQPITTATINIPNEVCPEGHAFIKDYSENEGVLAFLVAKKITSKSISTVNSGWLTAHLVKVL